MPRSLASCYPSVEGSGSPTSSFMLELMAVYTLDYYYFCSKRQSSYWCLMSRGLSVHQLTEQTLTHYSVSLGVYFSRTPSLPSNPFSFLPVTMLEEISWKERFFCPLLSSFPRRRGCSVSATSERVPPGSQWSSGHTFPFPSTRGLTSGRIWNFSSTNLVNTLGVSADFFTVFPILTECTPFIREISNSTRSQTTRLEEREKKEKKC